MANGYYLKRIRDGRLYEDAGYQNFEEYINEKYGKDKGWASKCIKVNNQLSVDGDSPILDNRYKDYKVYQLVELAYMTEEQRELATPEQTVKQLHDIWKPEKVVISQPDEQEGPVEEDGQLPGQMEITDFPEYLPGGTVFPSVAEPETEIVTEPVMNSVFRMDVNDMLPEEDAAEPQQEKESAAEIAAEVDPPKLEWYIGDEYETREAYCEAAARKFITAFREWMREDFFNRVQDVCRSEKEFKERFRREGNTWYFQYSEAEVAHVDLFDDYIQFWDGEGKCVGNCRWFYLCAAIQYMWNVMSLEAAREKVEAARENTKGTAAEEPEEEKECAGQEDDEEPGEEHTGTEPKRYDRRILEDMIADATEALNLMKDHWIKSQPDTYTKYVMMLDAYNMLFRSADEEGQPEIEREQPELPVMKNNDQRKAWLRDYRSWGLWYEDRNTGAKYYKYDFDNGARLITEEYEENNEYAGDYVSSFLHLVGGPEPPKHPKYGIGKWSRHEKYSRYPDSETELIEFLKEAQKGGRD